MDEANAAPQGNMNQENTGEHTTGPVIGIIIIVLIVILGGLYFWGSRLNTNTTLDGSLTPDEIKNADDPKLDALQTQSTSDALNSIENDLDATDLNDLDAELDQIENEVDSL